MNKAIVMATVAVAISAALTACGGGDDEGNSPFSTQTRGASSRVPSETTLCRITLGATTEAEAIAVLGEPDLTSDTSFDASLSWVFETSGVAPSMLVLNLRDGEELGLDTNARAVVGASAINVPYPECWRQDEAACEARFGEGSAQPCDPRFFPAEEL